MSKGEFPGKYGFKNSAPAFTKDMWSSVDLFLDTWDYLPGDRSAFESLDREELATLCDLALGVACKLDIGGDGIKVIQQFLHNCNLSPEAKSTN